MIVSGTIRHLTSHVSLHIRETTFSNIDDPVQIDFSLVEVPPHQPNTFSIVTEKFIYKLSSKTNHVIFVDVPVNESRDLYLCVQVWRYGRLLASEGRKSGSGHYKRALASGLVPLNEVTRDIDIAVRLYEGDFLSNFEFLYKRQTNKMTQLQNTAVNLICKVIKGDFETLITPATCLALRRSFGDVIIPGHVRSDLYVTIEGAEFEKGGTVFIQYLLSFSLAAAVL